MLLYRLLYIERETWGEWKNPSGSGWFGVTGGGGVLWRIGGDCQRSSGGPKVYFLFVV